MSGTLLHEIGFARAKDGLSPVMDAVIHERCPQVIHRSRGGGERMLLISTDDVQHWLDSFRLTVEVVIGDGDVAVRASPVGAIGVGASFDAAMTDLAEELRVRAQDFFSRPRFYLETDRADDYPYLLRFALTDPEGQLALLYRDAEAKPASVRELETV